MEQENQSIDECLTNYRPTIFWKDKEVVKQQIRHWSKEKIQKFIIYVNELELQIKKENMNSVNIIMNFILEKKLLQN